MINFLIRTAPYVLRAFFTKSQLCAKSLCRVKTVKRGPWPSGEGCGRVSGRASSLWSTKQKQRVMDTHSRGFSKDVGEKEEGRGKA